MNSYQSPPDNPKRLKTLVCDVHFSEGNKLLHQFVLGNSNPNISSSDHFITAVLRSVPGDSANDMNSDGYSALHLAVLNNSLYMVKKLLSCLAGIDVNARCNVSRGMRSALHFAVELENVSIVLELLDKKANVHLRDTVGFTAWHYAVFSDNLDLLKLLISKCANDNEMINRLPIHCAAILGELETVKFLISAGADVNALDENNKTPLHCVAITSNNVSIVEFLISNGADVNAGNRHLLDTPLHHAVMSGYSETVKLLIENGADVHARNYSFKTPLHIAAVFGHVESAKLLIEKGVDVNARDRNLETPLHKASYWGRVETVKLLIDQGADVHARNRKNNSPLQHAAGRSSSNLECLELLAAEESNVCARNRHGKNLFT